MKGINGDIKLKRFHNLKTLINKSKCLELNIYIYIYIYIVKF